MRSWGHSPPTHWCCSTWRSTVEGSLSRDQSSFATLTGCEQAWQEKGCWHISGSMTSAGLWQDIDVSFGLTMCYGIIRTRRRRLSGWVTMCALLSLHHKDKVLQLHDVFYRPQRTKHAIIMFESSASYPESDEGVEEDQAESGSTLYGAPDSTSEPEPHATCQLQGHGKLEALVTACNAVGTGDVDLALHCLAGRYIGVRKINVQRPVTSAGIHTAISHAWKDLPAGLGIIVHPILPQPWTSQSFALHFIAEFLPYTFWPKRRLVNPHLRQLVTTGVAGVDVCFEAFYATEGDEREPGGLQSVYGPFVPGFESQFWEDAERQLRTIHKYRDTLSHRVYRLHFHCIDTDGKSPREQDMSNTCRTFSRPEGFDQQRAWAMASMRRMEPHTASSSRWYGRTTLCGWGCNPTSSSTWRHSDYSRSTGMEGPSSTRNIQESD